MPRMHSGLLGKESSQEEGVEDRLMGMIVLGLLDPVLPGASREVKSPEDLGFLEARMIGTVEEDVRAKSTMDQTIDLEGPAERVPLGCERLDQRGVGHARSHDSGEIGSDADARGGIVAQDLSSILPRYVLCAIRASSDELCNLARHSVESGDQFSEHLLSIGGPAEAGTPTP
jgi:hypothetical protein